MLPYAVLLLGLLADSNLLDRLYERAQRTLVAGDLNAAMECLGRINGAKPGIPEVENLLGVVYSRKGDAAAAELHFRAALKIQPSYREARENLALFLVRQNRFPDAILEYRALLNQTPV